MPLHRAASNRRSLLLLAALLLTSGAAAAEIVSDETDVRAERPAYDASDPRALEVTEANLPERDAFWPFRVTLTRSWRPQGQKQALPAGSVGVLMRVGSDRRARIDFGRDGCYEVPVSATDLVEAANQVRTGQLSKTAPNLMLMVGAALIDPGSERAVPLDYAVVAPTRVLVMVFADPSAESFPELAAALGALPEHDGSLTVLVPEGRNSTGEVTQRLRSLEWTSPFAFPHLSDSLTRSLVSKAPPPPRLMLLSPEGRLLFDAPWSGADVVAKLGAARDQALVATELAQKPESR